MAAGDVYRLICQATQFNSVRLNTLAVQIIGATDPTSAQQQALADDFKGIWRGNQNSSVSWVQWQLRQEWGDGMSVVAGDCRREGGIAFAGTFTPPNDGVSVAEALPPQCAVVVTLVSGNIGRRKRGRWYAFGWSEGDNVNGLLFGNTANQLGSALTTFFNKYKDGGTSPVYRLGVWSERVASGCIPGPNGKGHVQVDTPNPDQAFTPITNYTLRNIIYSQRKRTIGQGR